MFNKYINKYFSLLNIEENDNDVILSEILELKSYSKPIKSFISSEINRIVYSTIDNIRNQTIFDQTNSDLLKLINRLEQELKTSIRLNSFEFIAFIKNIIEIRFNYICRPLTTLSHLIYKNSNEQSIHEIQNIMEYFDEYNYLLEGISDWYENNLDKNFLTKEEFENLIKEIDDDYIYNIDENEFKKLLTPLFKVFNFDDLEDSKLEELPIEALIIYFSEKGIAPILNILQEEFENDNLIISKERIYNLIDKLLDVNEEENQDNGDSVTNEELEYFGEEEISEELDSPEENEEFEELEYFSDDEEIVEIDDKSETSEEVENVEFEELEYFGEEELSEELDSPKEDTDFEDLEYFSDDEEIEENDEKLETSEEVESEDFEGLEYFGKEELSEELDNPEEDTDFEDLEYFSDDEEIVEIDDKSETSEETENEEFEELEYFNDEELDSNDENLDEVDLSDFLDDDSEINKEKE